MDERSERRLLSALVAKGWIDASAVEFDPTGTPSADLTSRWGPRLADLMDRRVLEEERLIEFLTGLAAHRAPPHSQIDHQTEATATDDDRSAQGSAGESFAESPSRYRIDGLVGRGGMGEVYKAYDLELNRWVALKLMHANSMISPERSLQEARAQARVDHPNICPVYDAGMVHDRSYIAMRYLDGPTLNQAAEQLSLEERICIVRDIAHGIHAAHRTGLIHRDLKPRNILIERDVDGALTPFVVDFGLARDQTAQASGLTVTGAVSGTPAYMSPEQAAGKVHTLDRRTDVYSLGVMLYELISGSRPHHGGSDVVILMKIVSEQAPPIRKLAPAVPKDVETIVMKCLDKEPARRYESARALAEDLDCFLDGEPISARPPGLTYLVAKKLQKHRRLAILLAVASLVVATSAAVAVHARWQSGRQARLAQRFGARVERVEGIMRYAAMLPKCDTTPYRGVVREEMAEIRSQVEALGKVAQGPGLYALGRGAMALGRSKEAHEYFKAAVAAGLEGQEVNAALGEVMSDLYEQARLESDRITDSALRGLRQSEIESELKQPAVSYLRSALSSGSTPRIEALLASLEGRNEQAVTGFRTAFTQQPWQYELKVREAAVLINQVTALVWTGNEAQVRALLDASGEALSAALEVARSDAGAYAGECRRRSLVLELAMKDETTSQLDYDEALAACRTVAEVDPDNSLGAIGKAELLLSWATAQALKTEDHRTTLNRAVAAAQEAIDRAPLLPSGHTVLGKAYGKLGHWELRRGLDPRPSLARSAEALRDALELHPRYEEALLQLGKSLYFTAYYERSRGLDPTASIASAIASFELEVEIFPGWPAGHTNLGNALVMLAEHQIQSGEDPQPSLTAAITCSDRAIELEPQGAHHHNNRGNNFLTLAEYQISAGDDSFKALAAAAASYQRAIELRPGYPLGLYNLGLTERFRANALLNAGSNPLAAVQQASKALTAAIANDPGDADFQLELARVRIIAARWAQLQGMDPIDDITGSLGYAAAGLEVNPQNAGLYAIKAEALLLRAEAPGIGDRQRRRTVDEASVAAGKALALNPTLAEALAVTESLRKLQRTAASE